MHFAFVAARVRGHVACVEFIFVDFAKGEGVTGASLLVSAILNFSGGLSIVDRNVFFFFLSRLVLANGTL